MVWLLNPMLVILFLSPSQLIPPNSITHTINPLSHHLWSRCQLEVARAGPPVVAGMAGLPVEADTTGLLVEAGKTGPELVAGMAGPELVAGMAGLELVAGMAGLELVAGKAAQAVAGGRHQDQGRVEATGIGKAS